MKSIIAGRLYNTDTATLVARVENMADVRNYHYRCETLYCKKNGEWFLHGEGHALSKYGKSYGDNTYGWGQTIIPYNVEDAKAWLAENDKVDEYITYFGEPKE